MRSGSVSVGLNRVSVMVPETADEYARGLIGRTIGTDEGMLFRVFGSAPYMSMLGMTLSLDLVYIQGGRVVGLIQNVPPGPFPVIAPVSVVDYILEVNAGYADSRGVRVGDAVSLS